ncbi:MAG: hypothetical protein ABIZ69_05220 [Ilumatobacteraceae bacterium]
MADANLFPDEAGFTPRAAWQVIEAARRRYLTGELTLPTTPATKIFLRDGMVYFAERSSDGALPIRLMMEGVITREQMQRGTVIVNGVEHVGRMFDGDPTIDRASVELCTELFTDDVMIAAANEVVAGYELTLYRRHPSGIDRWYPHTVPVTGRPSDQPDEQPDEQPAASAETIAAAKPAPEPKAKVEPRPQPQPQSAQATPAHDAQPKSEPKNRLNAPPITQAVPVTANMHAAPITEAMPVTEAVPTIASVDPKPPVAQMPPPTAQIPVTSPPPQAELDATLIADEVAEAIKRAFAGMGA